MSRDPDDYPGLGASDYFSQSRLLKPLVERLAPEALPELSRFGRLCAGRLARLVESAQKDAKLPRLKRGAGGLPQVAYCPEQVAARRLALKAGVLPPVPLVERMTKGILLNHNGEGGITCPLAMTDGLAQVLEKHGTPEQKKRWLPLVGDPSTPTPLTGGQFVTEKQGGSAVSENRTRAKLLPDGSWRLKGLKWFCSNPGELWVTTAKPEGSDAVALFLVPRVKPDGKANACRIVGLKDLSGTRGKATAEVRYEGAYAELLGRPSRGMVLLLEVLGVSRLHVAAASLGFLLRAQLEAESYARWRKVGGRPAAELPQTAAALERLDALAASAALAFYEGLAALERGDPAAEALVPLLKTQVSRAATEGVREARLILAGNGALRDFSVLPRLAEDALIQEIWEGTPPILHGHFAKALRRPASRAAFLSLSQAAPQREGEDEGALARRCYASLGVALLKRESGGSLDKGPRPFAGLAEVFATLWV